MRVLPSAYRIRTEIGDGPRYHRYHADLFSGEEVSCWEKHLVQQEIGRMTARAA
jgi:hypothetical protein